MRPDIDMKPHHPGASRRLSVLHQQMDSSSQSQNEMSNGTVLQRLPCSAEQQETVDAHTMECFIDQLRPVKASVYAAFIRRPELLPPVIEGMRKSEHRQLVRDGLKCIVDAGIEPLTFFDQDVRRYIYMAEICAPIDLSMVRLFLSWCVTGARSGCSYLAAVCLASALKSERGRLPTRSFVCHFSISLWCL